MNLITEFTLHKYTVLVEREFNYLPTVNQKRNLEKIKKK